ncbi:MAG: type II toxin-antitoxin system Phd/YefM family antitoxin [Solirubrobacteraceae bacterium]
MLLVQIPQRAKQHSAAEFPEGDNAGAGASVAIGLGLARIMVMSETLPLAAVKSRFSEIVDRVERQQDRVVVTRNGQPAAVLISPDDLESLEETLAVMSDRSITAQIRASKQGMERGETGADIDELRADLKRRQSRRR